MKNQRKLDELVNEYTRWGGHGGSYEANLLEALIVRASERFSEICGEIGSGPDNESREQLCQAIRNPEEWESRWDI